MTTKEINEQNERTISNLQKELRVEKEITVTLEQRIQVLEYQLRLKDHELKATEKLLTNK